MAGVNLPERFPLAEEEVNVMEVSVPEPWLALKFGVCSCFCLSNSQEIRTPEPLYQQRPRYDFHAPPEVTQLPLRAYGPNSRGVEFEPPRPSQEELQGRPPAASSSEALPEQRSRLKSSAVSSSGIGRQGSHLTDFSKLSSESDGEKLDWINDIVRIIWPKVGPAVQHILQKEVLPKIREDSPPVLRATMESIHFSKFDFGNRPPQLNNIRVFEISSPATGGHHIRRGLEIEISMDLSIDIDIEISLNKMLRLGVNTLSVKGDLVVRLEPLLNEEPVVGGVVAFFYDPPHIDIGFTGLGAFMQHPGIVNIVRSIVGQVISNELVLPNVFAQTIGREDQGVDLAHLRRPSPLGVVRVTALRARDLKAADWNMFGAGTSDPYVRIKLSDQEWKSAVIKKNCNPVWTQGNISHDFLVYAQDQRVNIDVYDEDLKSSIGVGKDDHIGRVHSMSIVHAIDLSEKAIELHDPEDIGKKAGELFLRFEWFEIGRHLPSQNDVLNEKLDLFVMEIKVDEVYMPERIGRSAGLHAKFGDMSLKSRRSDIQDKVVTTAVNATRVSAAKRCYKLDKTMEQIAYVTCLEEEELEDILQIGSNLRDSKISKGSSGLNFGTSSTETTMSMTQSWNAFKKKLSRSQSSLDASSMTPDKAAATRQSLELEYVLRFIVTRQQLQHEYLELSLFSGRLPCFGKAELTWESFDGTVRLIDFGGSSSASPKTTPSEVQADITVGIKSLIPGRRLERRHTHLSKGQSIVKSPSRSSPMNSPHTQPMTAKLKSEGRYCEWINEVLAKMWESVDHAVRKIVTGQVTNEINKQLPGMSVNFKKCSLGKIPPTLGPISVSEAHNMVELMIGVNFDSEIEIAVATKIVSVGIKSLKFHGQLCCRLMNLIPQPPIVGGVVIFFLDVPIIDYQFTETAKVANLLKRTIRNVLQAALVQEMVLPNVVSVPLGTEAQGVDLARLNRPPPISVLKVTAVKAENLPAADFNLISADSSDPYLKISFSDQSWTSPVVKATLNPRWTKGVISKYFMVYNKEQTLRVEIFDQDNFSSDDHIGSIKPLTIEEIENDYVSPMRAIEVCDPHTKQVLNPPSYLWLKFEPVSIGQPEDLSGHHVILEVKVDEVFLPAKLGSACKLMAKFGTEKRVTKAKSVDEPNLAANAVHRELEAMVKRSHACHFDTKDIEHITELRPQDITKMLSGVNKKLDRNSSRAVRDQTVYIIRLEYVLNFIVPTKQVEDPFASIQLELLDEGDHHLGTAKLNLSEVTGEMQLVDFANKGKKALKAEITVGTVGLIQSGPDDKTDVPEPAVMRSRVLSCLAGPCSKICSS